MSLVSAGEITGPRRKRAFFFSILIFLSIAFSSAAVAQVSVSISPAVISLGTMATQPFTAVVAGSTNTAVTWQVNGVAGGNSTNGLISTTLLGTANEALFLAPSAVPNPAVVSVTAISEADPTKSATSTVTIQMPSRSGKTYYVATTGSDSNAGTLNEPWRTIQHAANSVHAGDTVEVEGGTYNEIVTMKTSGDSTRGYITFTNYAGQNAIIDGTGLKVGTNGQTGLISLEGTFNYIIIQGFEIRNFSSSTKGKVPVGIDFEGAGGHIEILNNHIHNIAQTLTTCNAANALAVAIYGTQAPGSINSLTLAGNEIDHNTTGCSENVSFDGNVQYFVEANNSVHDGDNIGLDNIGFEGVSPNVKYDQARDGWVFGNTIYNISSTTNPVYHDQVGADAYYCDGCTRVIVERNLIHDSDLSEMASEHQGHDSSYVIFRNNVIYHALYVGISIGGYANNVGGTDHCMIVNNTLWDDGTFGNQGLGEIQIQFFATNNTIENNIAYASNTGYMLYDYTTSEAHPAVLDYNLYYTTNGAGGSLWQWQGKNITGFSNYQTKSGQDAHSKFADPQFVNIVSLPPNLDVLASSPAENAGTNLGQSIVGVLDFAGNPRVNGVGQINMGAYEQ
jgi:hypothetical protein